MAQASAAEVVYTGTAEWYEIVGGIETGETWPADWQVAAEAAEIDVDDEESWVARIEDLDDEHTALRVGDYVCCQGVGSDVIFVRLSS